MRKIHILYNNNNAYEAEIVYKGIVRSYTKSQVTKLLYSECNKLPELCILIEPEGQWIIEHKSNHNSKYIILGKLDDYLMGILDTKNIECPKIDKIINYRFAKLSQRRVHYINNKKNRILLKNILLKDQYCCRFDFTDEWNNMGYGRISFSDSPFSLSGYYCLSPNSLAYIKSTKNSVISDFIIVKDFDNYSVLWINRSIGLIDSAGLSIVENFISFYRYQDLPSLPYLLETTSDGKTIVTMRLDCDQEINSSRRLCELYFDLNVPISLAINSRAYIRERDIELIENVQKNHGSILSHSLNHYPNWGGSYTHALLEAKGSKLWLDRELNIQCEYAVSPFHQNPLYSIKALKDAGFKGFVGGIIHNDPEYMIYRSGEVPFVNDFVSLSQQCMLHGDCYHSYKNITPYIKHFLMKNKMNSIFGYLDHPFSKEYQYGWINEDERIEVHSRLINVLKNNNVKFLSLSEVMRYVYERSKINIIQDNGRYLLTNLNESLFDFKLSKS